MITDQLKIYIPGVVSSTKLIFFQKLLTKFWLSSFLERQCNKIITSNGKVIDKIRGQYSLNFKLSSKQELYLQVNIYIFALDTHNNNKKTFFRCFYIYFHGLRS